MPDHFESVSIRMESATEHLHELDEQLRAYVASKPYEEVVERDEEKQLNYYKVKLARPLSRKSRMLVHHLAEDLLSALDLCGAAAARSSGSQSASYAAFPIVAKEGDFQRKVQGRSKQVPPLILEYWKALRPWRGGNDALCILHMIANGGKHAELAGVVNMSQTQLWSELGADYSDRLWTPAPVWDSVKNETTFLVCGTGTRGLRYKVEIPVELYFKGDAPLGGKPVWPTMQQIYQIVAGIVGQTEARCRIYWPNNF